MSVGRRTLWIRRPVPHNRMFETKTSLSLHYQATAALPISISVDGGVIFDEVVPVPDMMPPIAFSKELSLKRGTHSIVCMDSERARSLTFDIQVPRDRSVLIRIEDDSTENSYTLSGEEMHFK